MTQFAVSETVIPTSSFAQNPVLYQGLIAGGRLNVCTSDTTEFCSDSALHNLDGLPPGTIYRLERKSFEGVLLTAGFKQLDASRQGQLKQLFQHFYANPVNVNSAEAMRQAFNAATDEFNAGQLFSNLPNSIYYAILDFAQQTPSTTSKVHFSRTKNKATMTVLREFIRQANLRRQGDAELTLSFITSAARDPFARVSYYQQLLEQAARDELQHNEFSVSWLALDQSLMQALEDKQPGVKSCAVLTSYRHKNQLFNARQRYPELTQKQLTLCRQPDELQRLLESSHGLFISDDSQTPTPPLRLLSLFRNQHNEPTLYQQIIVQRQRDGDLFIAGAGKGAAIMAGGIFENRPVPYITGGTSDVALVRGAFPLAPAPFGCEKDGNCPYGLLEDDLTYEARGGIGNFNLGAIDTDFSEQSRQARLAVLTASSKIRFGFGIDANTVMLYRHTANGDTHMQVIGENGVFIVDMRDAIVKTQSGKHQIIGLSHYLNHGDKANWSAADKELSFMANPNSEPLNIKTMILPRDKGEFRRNVAINCGTQSFHRWTENNIAWLINPTEDTKFYLSRSHNQQNCGYHNLLFGIEN